MSFIDTVHPFSKSTFSIQLHMFLAIEQLRQSLQIDFRVCQTYYDGALMSLIYLLYNVIKYKEKKEGSNTLVVAIDW